MFEFQKKKKNSDRTANIIVRVCSRRREPGRVPEVVGRDHAGQRHEPHGQPGGGDQLHRASGLQSGRAGQRLRRDAGHLGGAVPAHHQDADGPVRAQQPPPDGVHRQESGGVPQMT